MLLRGSSSSSLQVFCSIGGQGRKENNRRDENPGGNVLSIFTAETSDMMQRKLTFNTYSACKSLGPALDCGVTRGVSAIHSAEDVTPEIGIDT